MMPSCDHTGVPIHFHSSTTSGSASLMSLRILPRVSPRQSPSSAILFEMSFDADWTRLAPGFFMLSSWKFRKYLNCKTVKEEIAAVPWLGRVWSSPNHYQRRQVGSRNHIVGKTETRPPYRDTGVRYHCVMKEVKNTVKRQADSHEPWSPPEPKRSHRHKHERRNGLGDK